MIFRSLYRFLASARLAMALLITILLSCIYGVTVLRDDRAWVYIFDALWFNGVLILLVINVACCFFPRIWGKKMNLVSLGMILFHLSFVAILAGIVYNSLHYFRGIIRLTEGEVLASSDPRSYDAFEKGRYFTFAKLTGTTTLVRMHTDYRVDGANKRAAYEIAVGEGDRKTQGILYITKGLDHNGVTYLNEKEGHSVLVVLYDKNGKEQYGAYVPLQSLKQNDGAYFYTTGTKFAPGNFPFPQHPDAPLFSLQVSYEPSLKEQRRGRVSFKIWPLRKDAALGRPHAEGTADIGEKIALGEYTLAAQEVRFWVGMNVRYEPGKPFVMTSLWIGLAGMILTFAGRVQKKRTRIVS